MAWKDCNNKAYDPKPPFLFHCYCTHIFLVQMTASPSCLWPSEHLFGLFMNIFMCLPRRVVCVRVCVYAEGCWAFCMGRLYWLWQESPTGASGPWQSAAGPVLPRAQSLLQKNKSNTTPHPTCVSWKMTGRDILPSGHSQLTAINYTLHGR